MNKVQNIIYLFQLYCKVNTRRKQLKKTISAAPKSSIIFSQPVLTEHQMRHNLVVMNTLWKFGNSGWTAPLEQRSGAFSCSICAMRETLARGRSRGLRKRFAPVCRICFQLFEAPELRQPIYRGWANRAAASVVKLSQISPDIVRGTLASVS